MPRSHPPKPAGSRLLQKLAEATGTKWPFGLTGSAGRYLSCSLGNTEDRHPSHQSQHTCHLECPGIFLHEVFPAKKSSFHPLPPQCSPAPPSILQDPHQLSPPPGSLLKAEGSHSTCLYIYIYIFYIYKHIHTHTYTL